VSRVVTDADVELLESKLDSMNDSKTSTKHGNWIYKQLDTKNKMGLTYLFRWSPQSMKDGKVSERCAISFTCMWINEETISTSLKHINAQF
jgi:hypothetical protein